MVDPVDRIKNNINSIKNMKGVMEKDTAVSSFSHAIEGINKATANLKSLRRASKKIKNLANIQEN